MVSTPEFKSTIHKSSQLGYLRVSSGKRRGVRKLIGSGGGGGGSEESNTFGDSATVNLTGIEDFNGMSPFINRIKCSSREWSDGTISLPTNDARVNADYEIVNLPAGQTLTRYQYANLDNLNLSGFTHLKDGIYTLKWDGACVVDVIDGGTGISTVGNVTTFTLTQATIAFLRVRVRNLTGGPANATNIRFVHADHEALLAAGEILDPDFIIWMNKWTHIKAFRFLDWQQGNAANITVPADLPALSNLSWCLRNKGIPAEVIGEVAKKTNKNIWTVGYSYANDATILEFKQRIKNRAGAGWTGKYLCEPPNESWNFQGFLAFPHFAEGNYATTNAVVIRDENDVIVTPGAGFSLERLNSCYAHYALRVWSIADTVFGAANVVPIGSTQTNFNFLLSQWVKWFQTGFQGGARPREILNARNGHIAMTHYYGIWSAENVAGRTGKQMAEQDYGARTDQQWVDDWKVNIDQHATEYWLGNINRFTALGFTGNYFIYEGGNHDFIDQQSNTADGWSNFTGTLADGGTTLDFGADGTTFITNGEVVKPINTIITAAVPSFDQRLWARKIPATTKIRLYPSQVAYDGDVGNTGAGAALLINGPHTISNVTRHDRIGTKLFNLAQGARALEILQYIEGKFVGAVLGKIRGLTTYAAPGIMRYSNNQRFTYAFDAINRGIYSVTETPAMQYLIDLNNPV